MTAKVCPYCRSPIGDGDAALACEGCGTPHHADCYAENGGCTVFGCSKAPVDEPKISISTSDLTGHARPTVAMAAPSTPTPPPPRRAGATTSVPPPPIPSI